MVQITNGYLITQGELLPLFNQITSQLVDEISQAVVEKMKKEQGDEFITIKEACKILKISVPTLRKKRLEGEIPCYKEGKIIRFKRSEILDLANNTALVPHLSKLG